MKKISKLLVVFASFLGLSGVSFKETPVHALTGINGAEAPATAYSGQYVKEYYNSIEGLKKDALLISAQAKEAKAPALDLACGACCTRGRPREKAGA